MKQNTFLVAILMLSLTCTAQLSLDRLPPRIPLQPVEQIGFGGQYSIAPMPYSEGMTCRQRTYIGALIGLTLFTDVPDDVSYWGYRPGLTLSLLALYELNARMVLLGTLGWMQMGYSESYLDFEWRWRRNYLAAGFLFGYLFPLQSVQLGVLAGPMLGYWMSTNYLFIDKVNDERERENEPFVESPSLTVNRFLLGMAGGVMLRTNCGPGTVLAMALIMYGLTPHKKYTYSQGETYTRHNLGFMIGIGYAIALSQICNRNEVMVE